MPTLNTWLYYRKESHGALSFETEIQNLQFCACPVAGPLVAKRKGNFLLQNLSFVKLKLPKKNLIKRFRPMGNRKYMQNQALCHRKGPRGWSQPFPAKYKPGLLVMLRHWPLPCHIGIGTGCLPIDRQNPLWLEVAQIKVLLYGLIHQDKNKIIESLGLLGGHVPIVRLHVPLLMISMLSRQFDQKTILKGSIFELKQQSDSLTKVILQNWKDLDLLLTR